MKKTLEQQLLENLSFSLTNMLEDWNKVNHHDKTNGLSQKAVNAYRREHPGSKLQTAVTTKPSKLKPGSKAAKRRKSFCARMSGNKGPMKKPNGKPTPKALALRRWNCESIEEMAQMIAEGTRMIAELKKGAKDSNGFTKCWPGHHAAGTKKGKNGGQVRNCVPNEGVAEAKQSKSKFKTKQEAVLFLKNRMKEAQDVNDTYGYEVWQMPAGFDICHASSNTWRNNYRRNGGTHILNVFWGRTGKIEVVPAKQGVAEAHDPKFAGFMNQALGTRQDKKPLRVDPNTVMSMNNMPGYKHAFKFGMDIIKKMDPDTKEHFANEDDDALESYMIDIAEKKGFIPKYFVEEDLSEVVGEFEEIFHDPEMEGWSWADLLRDMIGQEPRAHEKANVQAHKQMMAKAQAEKDNPPPIDPNKLQVVDRTDTGKSEIWYPSGGFFGTDSWAVVQDGFKDKAHAEHALKQLKANPNVVNIIKKAIEDENMSESTGDKPFDTMMKSIKKGTKKQATADRREQKRQDQERTRDAIANMFGGGNPADKLSIRKKDVAEGGGAQQAAIAIAKKESGKYTKLGKRKK